MKSPKPKRSKWRRRALVLASVPVAGLGLWLAIHRVSWLGPLLADTARGVLGPGPVAWAENTAYAMEDRWNRLVRGTEPPKAYWDVPQKPSSPTLPTNPTHSKTPAPPAFQLDDLPVMHPMMAAPGDGVWVPLPDPQVPSDPPRMLKTLVHPDKKRNWTAVSIVAIDLDHVSLHLVAGRYEPENVTKEAYSYKRTGLIDPTHHRLLLAAFNGGFKTIHGHYGMQVDGVMLAPPRKKACAVALMNDEQIVIRSWETIEYNVNYMKWWRQTPACMFEQGKPHIGLTVENNTFWGSKLGGDTVIRRSAIGLGQDGKVLYVGIGDATTAPAIAQAMSHAGAKDVAELDVNWSFPKFLLYEPQAGQLVAKPLCDGFEYTEDDYIREASPRDFFYLTRRISQQSTVKSRE